MRGAVSMALAYNQVEYFFGQESGRILNNVLSVA